MKVKVETVEYDLVGMYKTFMLRYPYDLEHYEFVFMITCYDAKNSGFIAYLASVALFSSLGLEKGLANYVAKKFVTQFQEDYESYRPGICWYNPQVNVDYLQWISDAMEAVRQQGIVEEKPKDVYSVIYNTCNLQKANFDDLVSIATELAKCATDYRN